MQQQSSNSKLFSVASNLALQGEVNNKKLPIENDSNTIKKRKRGLKLGNLNYAALDVVAQRHHLASLKDIQAVPSTPPIFRKTLRHQATDGPLTPSSLDQSSSRKANVSSPVDLWSPNISQPSRKLAERLEMGSPENIKELSDNCTGSPALKPMMNQNQSIKTTHLDQAGMPGRDSVRNGLPYDGSPGHDNNGLKQLQRGTKATKFDQQFSPIMGQTTQCITWNRFLGSMEGRAGLENPDSDTTAKSKSLLQSGYVHFGVSRGTSEFSKVLIDLTESDEDDHQLRVGKQFRSPSDPVQKQVPELKLWSNTDPTWVKQGCKNLNPDSEQDLFHIQQEADMGGVAHQKNSSSGSRLVSDGVLSGRFSMSCALQNYICLRKERNSTSGRTLSHYFPVIKPSVVENVSKDDKSENFRSVENLESHIKIPSIPKPQYIIPKGCRYSVVSTCFLRNRKLACRIQRLYPGAEFIERDFALHEPSASGFQHFPNPNSQSINNSFDEADMTISPGTGIILTTLQKIRQCSLPGQAVRLIVRERIARVAPRYERLLILVSKDNFIDDPTNESGNVAPHEVDGDYKAAVDFIGFCSSLKQDTQAMFIAGKEEQLAEWIVAMMVKYAGVDLGIKLSSEITTWELFLRRAGFNSFAAQAVLGELDGQSTGATVSIAGDVGLTTFLEMSVEKRVERFEKIFGGSELLKRVSRQLDAQW